MACPVPLNLVCDAVGSATSSVAGGVLSAIAGWVVGGATWLLDELGQVITSSTAVNVRASWFLPHYKLMLTIAAIVAVPMLVLAAVQSVFQQNAGALVRAAFVHLPLAGLLTAAAVQIVQLALEGTDVLCTEVTTGTGGDLDKTFHSIGAVLSHEPLPLPTFVVTVGALLIVVGAFVLWLELLVRAAAIYAAVFFLPLALASLIWPAASQWCRRLTETLVALVLSKFVIVAVLSLAVGAVSSGDGFSTVLAGGALLLLAAFTPFTLLRLIPLVEVGAVMQLEGARQRVRASWGRAPDSAVGIALRQAREHGAHRETAVSPGTPGMPGTGMTLDPGSPGPAGGAGPSGMPRPSGPSGPSGPLGPLGAGGTGSTGEVEQAGGVGRPADLIGGRARGGGRAGAGGAVATGAAGAAAGAGGAVATGAAGALAGAGGAVATGAAGAAAGAGGAVATGAAGAAAGAGGAVATGAADALAGAGSGLASGARGGFDLGPVSREWLPPEGLTAPPGTIPVWPGSPESEVAALEATKRPHRVEPDGYGGVIPGVASPLWGGTEPLSRFEPGPKDDWSAWDVQDDTAFDPAPTVTGSQTRGAPPFIDRLWEEPDADGSSDAPEPVGGTVGGTVGGAVGGTIGGAVGETGTYWDPDDDRDGA